MRNLWQLNFLARRVRELAKALVYTSDAPFYVDAAFIPALAAPEHPPTRILKRRRLVEAFFAWKGVHIIPVYGFQTDQDALALIGHEGVLYPIRDVRVPFEVYEVAVTFIRDGMAIPDAFETARLLA